MKKRCLLLLLLIPLASAISFCEENEDYQIISINDNLVDNDEPWNWHWGDDIEINVLMHSDLEEDYNFTAKLYFLNEKGEIENISTNEDTLKKQFPLDENETDDVDFDFKLEENVSLGKYNLYLEILSLSRRICIGRSLNQTIIIDELGSEIALTLVNGSSNVSAGSNGTYVVKIENLKNKKEDQIKLYALNSEWKIYEEKIIQNLSPLSSVEEKLEVSFPEGAKGSQNLFFYAQYDYDSGKYKKSTTEDGFDKKFLVTTNNSKEETLNYSSQIENISNDFYKVQNVEVKEKKFPWIWIIGPSIAVILILAAIFYIIRKKSAYSAY